ncbi:pectinesterase-like [Primulina tabacum]|uniref:pectinesterase-like n=1 Tax=Primulina tabacum TaxID=48773 RepID=UPI003F59C78B
MGNFSGSKKKLAIAGLASILLVAMVVAVAVTVANKKGDTVAAPASDDGGNKISATAKAVKAICSPTDYKETCEESLSNANSTDPKELIKVVFEVAVKNISDAIKKSSLLKKAAEDPRTKAALETCEELLETSIDDLQRSFEKVGAFDMTKVDEYIEDLKTWLSAAITYQETCIDGFENTTGDTGEKMKKLLKTAAELSSNGLAMVTDFSSVLSLLQIEGFSRKLLSDSADNEESEKRRLYDYGHDESDYYPWSPPSKEHQKQHGRTLLDNGNYPHTKNDVHPDFVSSKARRLLAVPRAFLRPNIVVAQDGSGKFRRINDALATVPKKNNNPFVIFVKAGLYKETVRIPRKMNNIILIGEGPTRTIITGSKNFAEGTQTFHTATVAVNGDDFIAMDIGFENTAGPEKHQAVALRVSGDRAIFQNVHMNGYQDTLYAHAYRQYYRNCLISGTIDFVFGDAVSVFQRCRFVVRQPMKNQACMVTAQGRKDPRGVGVIVIQNSDIVPEPAFVAVKPALKAFLGRPWKEYSRTIIMHSYIDGFIDPEGWSPWAGTYGLNTLYYAEYQNRGAGSNLSHRVRWKGIKRITPQIAQSFTGGRLYQGDQWITSSGVSYSPGL